MAKIFGFITKAIILSLAYSWISCVNGESGKIYRKQVGLDALTDHDEDDKLEDMYGSMVRFYGGEFIMGVNDPKFKMAGEFPMRLSEIKSFKIDRYPVTNEQYMKFAKAKPSFSTDAEINDYSYVFHKQMRIAKIKRTGKLDVKEGEPWWIKLQQARWNQPEGKGTKIDKDRLKHPVVHISYHDAAAYCHWKGRRLPTESEWEHASRGNNKGWTYPWGDSFIRRRMNTWQGTFPTENMVDDSWEFTSPVDAFPAQNERGMYDMLGNVWEWTKDSYAMHGEDRETYRQRKVVKGGSFVDNIDYKHDLSDMNHPVRCSSRKGQLIEETISNVGFRCAKDWNIEMPKPPSAPPSGRHHKLDETIAHKMENEQRKYKMKKLREQILRKRQFQILRTEEL